MNKCQARNKEGERCLKKALSDQLNFYGEETTDDFPECVVVYLCKKHRADRV